MTTNRTSSSSTARMRVRVGPLGIVALLLAALALLAPVEALHALVAAEAAPTLQAQGGSPLASQTLGRGYWHVFIAYAVAWLLVLGWAISIARRLSKVEREIEE